MGNNEQWTSAHFQAPVHQSDAVHECGRDQSGRDQEQLCVENSFRILASMFAIAFQPHSQTARPPTYTQPPSTLQNF